ncbi:hypothetical protein CDD81_6784 [Ophiocordyceps australis]|uniref:Uncharacterized protein n=1 Tax=Ophiocordyceps australis TaxID=1399860 RepID=A0A2C5XZP3_9HYPO|nr:hypothetical protein CDD81_6784 [Ophiocordyceps australis]
MASPTPAPLLDVTAISGIFGSISIAFWVVVSTPQLIQQYRQGNANGLSIRFMTIWILGDVFNVLGAMLQGVLPTMIILAIYYIFADGILWLQCFYYRGFRLRDEPPPAPILPHMPPGERTALLASSDAEERPIYEWPSLAPPVPDAHQDALAGPKIPSKGLQNALVKAGIVTLISLTGVLGWYISHLVASWSDDHEPADQGQGSPLQFNVLGQIFGYICTVFYTCSRLPQLILNWRRKTTNGLSILFFMFTCLGNVNYALSILIYVPNCADAVCKPGEASQIYWRYILINLSWLSGCLLTLALDLCILAQYYAYQKPSGEKEQGQIVAA